MSTADPESLVSVYSTPVAFDAELVKSMLADEDIPSTVENSSGPFPGLTATPCQVFVTKENENFARRLVEEHEAQRAERVERESDLADTAEYEAEGDELIEDGRDIV